jgi:hypothetical protein
MRRLELDSPVPLRSKRRQSSFEKCSGDLAARLRYASVFVRNSRRLTTIGSSEFLREIHPDLKILLPRQGQRVTNAPASCCRVWAAP